MKTLLNISWRNIWRHPARSSVLLAAIIIGLWAGVMAVGTMNGMLQQRTDHVIDSELTHVQVHHPEFLSEGYSWMHIPDHESITSWLDDDERVASHTSRVLTDGMLQSPVKTTGIRIRGINVDSENRTTTFHENMVEGDYLDTDMRNPVIIGRRLAEEHNLDLGHRIVLTFEDVNNELTSGSFNIAGFFESASADYDKRNVLIRSGDFLALLSDQPVYHEIAMMLEDDAYASPVASDLNDEFPDIHAQTWSELSPELNLMVQLGGSMTYIITMIIMIALAFGILNTMLMALFERMRELGMLISIGMSRLRVFTMIMLESVMLSITGAIAGMLLARASLYYFRDTGINLEIFADAQGFAEIGFDHIIYPIMTTGQYTGILVVVIFITLLASLYPALKAIRINPLEAAKDH